MVREFTEDTPPVCPKHDERCVVRQAGPGGRESWQVSQNGIVALWQNMRFLGLSAAIPLCCQALYEQTQSDLIYVRTVSEGGRRGDDCMLGPAHAHIKFEQMSCQLLFVH